MAYTFDLCERLDYVRRFGSQALSYTTLQPNMQYFDVAGLGYITYQTKLGRRYVLGDPVCHFDDLNELIGRFLADGDNAMFLPIQLETARVLWQQFGYFSTQIGCDTHIDLHKWSPVGRHMRNFRRAIVHAQRRGVEVNEVSAIDPTEIHRVNKEWRQGRRLRKRSLGFVTRPIDAEPEAGVRKFVARMDGELIGYVVFDPIFHDGDVIGYGPNLSAFTSAFRNGLYYLIVERASRVLRDHGGRYLNLGLSPLDVVAPNFEFEARAMRIALAGLRLTGDRIYNFNGLSFIKRKFYGDRRPVFVGHNSRLPVTDILGFLRLSRII